MRHNPAPLQIVQPSPQPAALAHTNPTERALYCSFGKGVANLDDERETPRELLLGRLPRPFSLLRRQGHLRSYLNVHPPIVIEHLRRGYAAGFEDDRRHL